jgi:hypothetical protein
MADDGGRKGRVLGEKNKPIWKERRGALKIRKCRKCGFSAVYARLIRWNNNGTLSIRVNPRFRILLLEAESMTRMMEDIERGLGVSIKHLFFEAERLAAVRVIDANLIGPGKLVKHLPGAKRIMPFVFCRVAVGTGMGYAKALAYRPGRYGEAIVRNPFDVELMAAVICGSFECIERKPFDYRWKESDGERVIHIEPAERKPEIAERMDFSLDPLKPGKREFQRCPGCGTPELLQGLEWREDEGIIYDRRRGVRMVFVDMYTPNVVIRELARELGDDVYPLIIEAQRLVSLRNLSEEFLASSREGERVDTGELRESLLEELAVRGLGNPVEHRVANGRWTVRVDNPYNRHLLAGHLQAIYQFTEGRKPQVSWSDPDPSTVDYALG